MRRSILIAVSALAALGAGAVAMASTGESKAPGNIVSAAALDLSNPYDADRMLNRLEGAARHVCGVVLTPQPLAERQAAAQCVDAAMQSSVAQLGNDTVSARFEERGIGVALINVQAPTQHANAAHQI